jgi:hypothetical protein
MQKVRVYWHVCAERHGDWECIGSYHTRTEAQADRLCSLVQESVVLPALTQGESIPLCDATR